MTDQIHTEWINYLVELNFSCDDDFASATCVCKCSPIPEQVSCLYVKKQQQNRGEPSVSGYVSEGSFSAPKLLQQPTFILGGAGNGSCRVLIYYQYNYAFELFYKTFVYEIVWHFLNQPINDVESINRPPVYLYYRLDSAFNSRFTAAISQLSVIRQPQQLLFRQHHKQ